MKNVNGIPFFRIRQKGKKTRFYVDNELVENAKILGLNPRDMTVYCAIARHAHSQDQAAFPSYETIMLESAVGNRGTLSKCMKKLESLNLHKIEHSLGRSSNIYILSDPSCWRTNSIRSATDIRSDGSSEQYHSGQVNSSSSEDNSGTTGTRSHTSNS